MAADNPIFESSPAVDEWIVRTLQGMASDAEEWLLAMWCNASPANDRHFRETERIWAAGAGLRQGRERRQAPTVHELTRRAE